MNSQYLDFKLLTSPLRQLFDKPVLWVFAICLSQILCVPAANAGPTAPPMTTSPGGTATNNNGIAQDNSTTPKDTRDAYFKRNPRALWAHQMDTTQKITGSNLGGNTNTQSGTDSVPDKSDSLDNEPTSPTSSNSSQVNALKSTGPGYGGYEAYTLIPPDPYCPLAYWQPEFVNFVTTLSARDAEMFQMPITTYGYPISDTQFQIIDRENKQRFIELLCDPERVMWVSNAIGQMSKGYVGNALANLGQKQFGDAANRIVGGDSGSADVGTGGAGLGGNLGGFSIGALANIANENLQWAGANSPYYTSLQAIGMVQVMYKEVFIPMAILLLLPGALITQFRAMIAHNFNLQTDEAGSPFVGILRAMIALFLIPSTQLIVSYSIDVGNSLAYSVAQWVNLQIVLQWSNELAYDPPPSMMDNAILPPQGGNGTGTGSGSSGSTGTGGLGSLLGGSGSSLFSGLGLPSFISNFLGQLLGNFLNIPDTGEGLGSGQPSQDVHLEEQSFLSGSLQMIFNLASTIFSIMLMVLTAFQLVYMCYLYLMGPLAAAFYAWPQLSQNMFKSIFTNWVQAVINLALWRFWWMLILAIMTQRMIFIQNHGETLNLQWEIAVFTCFVGLMFYVPTSPWQFQAGQAYTSVIAAGSSIVGGAGGKGGGMAGLAAEEMKAGGASDAQVSQMTNAVYGVTSSMYNVGMQAEQLQTEGTARGAALNASQGTQESGTPAPPMQQQTTQTNTTNQAGTQGATNPVPLTGVQNNQANAGNTGATTNNTGSVSNYQTPSSGQSRTGTGQGGVQVNQNVQSNPTAIANAQTQVNKNSGGGQQPSQGAPPPPPPTQSSPTPPPPPPPPPTPPPPPPTPPPQAPPPPPQGGTS